jgi:hypothetical protein
VAASRQDHGGQAKKRTSRAEAVSWALFRCILRRPARLDLGHARPTFPNAWGTHVDTARSSAEEAEEGRGSEGSKGEVQECCRSLSFAAAALGVAGTVRDVVGSSVALQTLVHTTSSVPETWTYGVAARVNTEASCESGSSGKNEEGVEAIQGERDDGMTHEAVVPC